MDELLKLALSGTQLSDPQRVMMLHSLLNSLRLELRGKKRREAAILALSSVVADGGDLLDSPCVGHLFASPDKAQKQLARQKEAKDSKSHQPPPALSQPLTVESSEHARAEIVVCHGNVIRYFVLRALQLPADRWLHLSVGHCSVTHLVLQPDGRVELRRLGDQSHLPKDLRTS